MNLLFALPLLLACIAVSGLFKIIRQQRHFERDYFNNHMEHY